MIKQGGHEARQASEIERLEKKIEYTRQMTDTKIADRTYRLNKVCAPAKALFRMIVFQHLKL
jgi:hypothetical protein